MNKTNSRNRISRKSFIKNCGVYSLSIWSTFNLFRTNLLFGNNHPELHQAKYWKYLSWEKVKCMLCPNECNLNLGENGDCHARGNRDSVLYSMVYSKPSVIMLDEIEKSPLYHYQINEKVFSIATAGCNLACQFCQNYEISQVGPDAVETFDLEPKDVIERAKKHKVNSINFFYTEPIIYYEYMLDIAKLAKNENMKTFCVTAGYINSDPLNELIPYIDAFVLGLKGFDDEFYKKYIGCSIEPIKNTLKILANKTDKTWFEIVNLLIPGLNDNDEILNTMCAWIYNEIGNNIPLHFTRFEPAYKMTDTPSTPINTLEKAYKIAKENGLQYVYVGNVPGHEGNNTICPKCNKTLIERVNYTVINNYLENGKCSCGNTIPGHWL